MEEGDALTPVEIKSGQTIAPDFTAGLRKWNTLSGMPDRPAFLVYGGTREMVSGNVTIIPWMRIPAGKR